MILNMVNLPNKKKMLTNWGKKCKTNIEKTVGSTNVKGIKDERNVEISGFVYM